MTISFHGNPSSASLHPLSGSYPWYTPYQFAGKKPISNVDLDGLEDLYSADGKLIGSGPLQKIADYQDNQNKAQNTQTSAIQLPKINYNIPSEANSTPITTPETAAAPPYISPGHFYDRDTVKRF